MQPEQDQPNWQQPTPPPTNEYHPAAPVAPEQPAPVVPTQPVAPQPVVAAAPTPVVVAPPAPITAPVAPVQPPVIEQPTSVAEQPVPVAPMPALDQAPVQAQPQVETASPAYQSADVDSDPEGDEELIRWEATEVIDHDRPPVWYTLLGIVVVVLIALAIFLLHSVTFAILIPIMAAALIVYTRKPPAQIQYILSRKGLHINDKLAPYDEFRAFSVVTHAGHNVVTLIPRKRFALSESVFFPDEVGETIVDMLAARLPMKETEPDVFDRIINHLRL